VFYPTLEEMKTMSLEKYVESIEEQLEEYGIGRIVPPKGWTPRRRGYDDVDFTVEKAITQHATGRKGLFRTLLVEKKPLSIKNDFKPMAELPENQPSKAAMEDPTHAALEREFWKKVAYDPPTYCADVAGTLFDQPEEKAANDGDARDETSDATRVTEGWDVSRLDSLLSRTLREKNITLKGVNSSYLYFGMWRALFAWHTEDCDLYSVNYLHYGAPKFWYAVAPEDRERFEILAQGMVPEMWRACPEFLRHKELLISPTLLEQNGIPFTRMMQKPGEFVVTYPGSYHSGFNCGYNCAESCNFATEAWVEIGEDAGVCECVPDAVSLDMRIFGDLCTRCHDTDSETESESESESATESGAGASEMKLGKSRATAADAARRARLGSAGGRATRKRAASVSSDDDEKEKEKEGERKKRAKLASASKPARLTEKKQPAVAKRRGDGRKDVLGARGVDALGGDARRARRAPPRGPGAPPERGGRPRHVLHLPRRRGG
jgi:jumonji domain-containing protein 2